MSETGGDKPTKTPIVFGETTIESINSSLRKPSKAEMERIARNATHTSKLDTSRPIPEIPEDQRPHLTFPEPKVKERDGKRYTSLGKGTHLYTGPHGDEKRELIGDLDDVLTEGEYVERVPHPNAEMMPSIMVNFDIPVKIRTPEGKVIEYHGMVFGDRRGEEWDGMIEPSTKRRIREQKNL